jgi:hypothetical protein
VRAVLSAIAVAALVLLELSCQASRPAVDTSRDAIRVALRAAWRAYALQSPADVAATSAGISRAAGVESVSHFEAEGNATIASLDSAVSAIPDGGAERRYLRETLSGLGSTLRGRQHAQIAVLESIRDEDHGVQLDEKTGTSMFTAMGVADGIAKRTILRLAAWERRYLHESYLADSYVGSLLASVESARAEGRPDSTLLHRPEIEDRIAWADSVVVAEVGRIRGEGR